MKSLFWKVGSVLYIGISFFKKMKLELNKKRWTNEEMEEYIYKTTSAWGKNCINRAGIKVKVIGKENLPKENCLFVANHQGFFDMPLMLGFIEKPMGFIAKKEFLKFPIVNYWMKKMHCIFLDRENVRESVKSINEGVENLKNGYSMVIFPEGTRSKGNIMGEFKKGAMKLGTKADVPIVPVTINGTYKAYEANNNNITSAEITLVISKPIYAKDFTKQEQGNLSEVVKEIISKGLVKEAN